MFCMVVCVVIIFNVLSLGSWSAYLSHVTMHGTVLLCITIYRESKVQHVCKWSAFSNYACIVFGPPLGLTWYQSGLFRPNHTRAWIGIAKDRVQADQARSKHEPIWFSPTRIRPEFLIDPTGFGSDLDSYIWINPRIDLIIIIKRVCHTAYSQCLLPIFMLR